MKKLFLVLLLGTSYIVSAQFNRPYQEGDTVYYNKRYRIVNKELGTQYAVIKDIQTQERKKVYTAEFYQKDTESKEFTKTEIFSSKSMRFISREGMNTIFWENGQKKEEGNRIKGKRMGIWVEWYQDGTKMSEYEYFDDKEVSNSKGTSPRLVNFWNQQGEPIVKDGNGNYFLKNDDGEEYMGKYVNSQKEGVWQGFRKNGSKIYEESYKAGVLQQGESWDKAGNRYTYDQLTVKGEYSEGRKGLVKVISENFKVPKFASEMGIEGTSRISFEVNKEGSVENIEVYQSLCKPCDQEAIRVVKLMKKWKPSKSRGQNVRSKYVLPFRIKLTSK
jgi:TonB family protein